MRKKIDTATIMVLYDPDEDGFLEPFGKIDKRSFEESIKMGVLTPGTVYLLPDGKYRQIVIRNENQKGIRISKRDIFLQCPIRLRKRLKEFTGIGVGVVK